MLTKSLYLAGLQCPKQLFYLLNSENSEVNSFQQKIFDVGEDVGVLATSLFSSGIKVTTDSFSDNINETKKLINSSKVLFEAGFLVGDLFSRADILVYTNNGWDIIEVKSSASVKEINIHDVSFQKYVYEKAGLKINNCYLMHIDTSYVLDNELEVDKLFKKVNITSKVKQYSSGIEDRIKSLISIKDEPIVSIGKHCKSPYECSFIPECWKDIPSENVFDLYRGGEKSWKLFEKGIVELSKIPSDFNLNSKQKIQVKGEVFVDAKKIGNFLDELKYPIYYFDFEAINPCVPLFDGMSPYSRVPFQYSLHIQREIDGPLEHVSFLGEYGVDPREPILKSMRANLGSSGTILAWNQSYEIGVIKELISYFPSYSNWGLDIISRFNDLIIPFKNFWYYDPIQKGSCSLKKVLPVFSDLSYGAISNGFDASLAYESLGNSPNKEKTRSMLEEYCYMDTLAEVEILKGLRETIINNTKKR